MNTSYLMLRGNVRLEPSYFEQWEKHDDGSFMLADAHINHPARLAETIVDVMK